MIDLAATEGGTTLTESARAIYTLSGLLDQFVLMGGPSMYGPGGLAILTALWRKSSKLGWSNRFIMSNTEVIVATGIKSRTTIGTHRTKLQAGGFFKYTEPPQGKDDGEYILNFQFYNHEPVQFLDGVGGGVDQKLNDFADNELSPTQVVQNLDTPPPKQGQVVQNLEGYDKKAVQFPDDSDQVVQKLNDFLEKNEETRSKIEHLLKDTITTNTTSSNKVVVQNLDRLKEDVVSLLRAYSSLHSKSFSLVKEKELKLMVSLVVFEKIPLHFILRTMQKTFQKYSTTTSISSFCYYEGAIKDGWASQLNAEMTTAHDHLTQLENLRAIAEGARQRHGTG